MDCFLDPACLGAGTGGGTTGGTSGGTSGGSGSYVTCVDPVTEMPDCSIPSCALYPGCYESDCSDGIDQDNDGLIDCGGADPDCDDNFACIGETGLNQDTLPVCFDGQDNDYDGLIDCDDTDCAGDTYCAEAGFCSDGIDNDGDGNADEYDTECATSYTQSDFDGAFEGTFAGSMVFNILQSQSVTQWCVGSIELNSTVNGYERASVSGIGECQNASGSSTIDIEVRGTLFRSNATQGVFVGQVVHTVSQFGNEYKIHEDVSSSSLYYNAAGNVTTLDMGWSVVLPNATGTLLPITVENSRFSVVDIVKHVCIFKEHSIFVGCSLLHLVLCCL